MDNTTVATEINVQDVVEETSAYDFMLLQGSAY
jgi:hypothetical protein